MGLLNMKHYIYVITEHTVKDPEYGTNESFKTEGWLVHLESGLTNRSFKFAFEFADQKQAMLASSRLNVLKIEHYVFKL